jgi:hypothetical protein
VAAWAFAPNFPRLAFMLRWHIPTIAFRMPWWLLVSRPAKRKQSAQI